MKTFKPMLATPIDFSKINPDNRYIVSPKLDGVRCLVNSSGVFTRSMKPLPNKHIVETLTEWVKKCVEGYWIDGEIIVGNPQLDPLCYRNTVSVAMSEDKIVDDWWFCAFDCVDIYKTIKDGSWYRYLTLYDIIHPSDRVKIVPHWLVNASELKEKCDRMLELGYEGAMISPERAPYRFGRATPKSMELMKYKAWEDDEATVIGYVQKEKNTNEAKVNELGNTERSSHKSGMVAVNELGALVVDYKGKHFNIGSGFTEEERIVFWLIRDGLVGKMVKFKYMPYGEYEVPRLPIYLGFRDKKDL